MTKTAIHPVEQLARLDELKGRLKAVDLARRAADADRRAAVREIGRLIDEAACLVGLINRERGEMIEAARESVGDDPGRARLMADAVAEMVGPPVPVRVEPTALLLYEPGRERVKVELDPGDVAAARDIVERFAARGRAIAATAIAATPRPGPRPDPPLGRRMAGARR